MMLLMLIGLGTTAGPPPPPVVHFRGCRSVIALAIRRTLEVCP